MISKEQALEYHSKGRRGKIEVTSTKPCLTQRDLSLAYTPGVAEPCREIERDPTLGFRYTARGNLVAVVSNGTAVLGLGNIGALAGKPVMEGKGVLFKRFADVDVFDIELDTEDPDEIIQAVRLMEPTFGGINLEDIKAPECFYIEEKLKEILDIPVFHDDQHGTAIISGAGLINALAIVGKKIEDVKVVFNGAGASGIACALHYVNLGVLKENIVLCDSRGVVHEGRDIGMNPYKAQFATSRNIRTLAEAFEGADVFCGLSKGGVVSQDMVRSMADNPIVFAMANPDPEITYEDATAARDDLIMATGRSDYPNQVNNVLGFPFIFRGALDVRATAINEEMKIAATMALANLTKEPVPEAVMKAYGVDELEFGPDYIIPKPFDSRVLIWEASAVAQAAMDTGVARKSVDIEHYKEELQARLGKARQVMRVIFQKARKNPKRIVLPEGDNDTILKACHIIMEEKIAEPVLLGEEAYIREKMENLHLNGLEDVEIVNPWTSTEMRDLYAEEYWKLRRRKGATRADAMRRVRNRNVFGIMMVQHGDADGMVSGVTRHYDDTLRPALEILKTREGIRKLAGVFIVMVKNQVYFFADAAVNIDTDAETLADIAITTADTAREFDIEPRVAMLSFSNFGGSKHPCVDKMREAIRIVNRRKPDLIIDGEMSPDTALVPEILQEVYPFSNLKKPANILIFPDMQVGNIAFKLVNRLAEAESIGPVLMGMTKPVHLLQVGASEVKDVVNMVAISVVDAQLAAADAAKAAAAAAR